MSDLVGLLERVKGIHQRIADDVPQIKRGMVWCRTCGNSQAVNGAHALAHGWPKCCGYTMTIDAPNERTALIAKEPQP